MGASRMLVKKMLNGIMMKEITIKELADQYDVSTRTIQLKIKKLGYEWDSKESIYRYVGEESEPLDVDFSTLISKNSKMPAEQKLANSEVAASTSYVNESESINNSFEKASTNASKYSRCN